MLLLMVRHGISGGRVKGKGYSSSGKSLLTRIATRQGERTIATKESARKKSCIVVNSSARHNTDFSVAWKVPARP